jgi:hypothetical protein
LYGDLPRIGEINGFPVQIQNPPKTAVLRLPTNEEMLAYQSKQKFLYRSLGRRKGQLEPVPNVETSLELFKKLRIDRGEEFDGDEAEYAIGQLTQCKISKTTRAGDSYVIVLRTMFGDVTFTMGIPVMRDLSAYRRARIKGIDLPHGVEERRLPPEPAAKLFDACIREVEGYAEGITDPPPHHKAEVVVALSNAIEDLDPELDPNS